MSEATTQCPHCRTAFRVTAAQLEAAAGVVRCGSCRHIFNANGPKPAAILPTAALSPLDEPSSSPHPLRDGAGSDDDGINAVADPDGGIGLDDSLDDSERFDDGEQAQPEWLMGEEPQERANHRQSFLDLEDWEEEPRSIFNDLGKLEAELESDEQWAHELLRELEQEDRDSRDQDTGAEAVPAETAAEDFVPPPAAEPEAVEQEPASPPSRPDSDAIGQDEARPNDSATRDVPPHAARDDATGRRRVLELEPEPLQLSRRSPARPRRQGLYIAISLVAAGILAMQYLFFHFDRLAAGPQRAALAELCHWLDCELPARSAPELIRTGNLMVRSHPDQPGALVVDAIITNQAPFAQAWPVLRLTFSDIDGTPIATRGFRPDEYLAGEVTGAADIPSRRPVHVALELVDPGPRAINYELYLEPAATSGSTRSR